MKKIYSAFICCIALFTFISVFPPENSIAGEWSSMTSGTTVSLKGVWGSSGSDVFAVGNSGTILHYDGSAWSPMTSGTTNNLNAVWGSSGSDVFAVGGSGTILHYDGSAWASVSPYTTRTIRGLWGASGTDVFTFRDQYYYSMGSILHYNGSSWQSAPSPYTVINSFWGTSGTDIYAAGGDANSNYLKFFCPAIFHYNGSSWSIAYWWWQYSLEPETSLGCSGIWGSSSSNVFAGGLFGEIVHYDGSTWSLMTTGTTQTLHCIWGSSGSDVFAVGDSGTILHYTEQTLIELASLTASVKTNKVVINWSTASELDNAGFNLYRAEAETGEYKKINAALIPAKGSATQAAEYEFTDKDVRLWKTYYYKLEDIDLNGVSSMHGPVSATVRLIR